MRARGAWGAWGAWFFNTREMGIFNRYLTFFLLSCPLIFVISQSLSSSFLLLFISSSSSSLSSLFPCILLDRLGGVMRIELNLLRLYIMMQFCSIFGRFRKIFT